MSIASVAVPAKAILPVPAAPAAARSSLPNVEDGAAGAGVGAVEDQRAGAALGEAAVTGDGVGSRDGLDSR